IAYSLLYSPAQFARRKEIPQMTLFYKGCAVLLLTTFLLAGAGCAKLSSENSNASGGGRVADNSSSGQPPPPQAAETISTTWETKASSLNATEGKVFTTACSPGGTGYSVWGNNVYTSDSSICTAAVHSGFFTFQDGGSITIQIRSGRPIYGCTE